MADQILRNASGKQIGRITQAGRKLILRDPSGKRKGSFDPVTNETRDTSGRLVGKGNLLSMLLA